MMLGISAVWTLCCIGYGRLIRATDSGTGFFRVWYVLAGIALSSGILTYLNVWEMLPEIITKGLIGLLSLLVLSFVIIEFCIMRNMHEKGQEGLDYLIVLGAQVKEEGPSSVLRSRLDRAMMYLKENPETICIVSGGQGPNEPFPEAVGMADYLKQHGIAKQRILLENRSKTTKENLINSRKLLPKRCHVGVVTNNFHMFRTLCLVKKLGMQNVCGIASRSNRLYLPNNMLREYFAVIKFLLF